ncbi:TetR family transcriptional regulator [Jatrophihabitans sp. GAS493]|uniref:TetR/AcrR family transcriptional regulator n=1 Tax=Jatrophihabitans sp. GAS493 TaxID=1907575 RepID=UPI000BB96F07|nr:TetR/AcrR family transcriptional regulator [Jatrophihabitans sp. GAS493]SOD72852.1 TetR family transcriptional regulator [Jatrophihabitans sp. GAS493]
MATGKSVRTRVRAEMTEEIKAIAREHLARDGANLSLRAVARDLGMVSSAVYRYFASRDELLTALIVDAYNAVGAAAEETESALPRSDLRGRVLALGRGARSWARQHPAEYALVFGSPVPGYVAPRETVDPAARIPLRIGRILQDAAAAGATIPPGPVRLPAAVRADMKLLGAYPDFAGIPEAAMARGVGLWSQIVGLISFELFGHLVGGVADYDAFFDYQLRLAAVQLGLSSGAESVRA